MKNETDTAGFDFCANLPRTEVGKKKEKGNLECSAEKVERDLSGINITHLFKISAEFLSAAAGHQRRHRKSMRQRKPRLIERPTRWTCSLCFSSWNEYCFSDFFCQ